MNWNKSMEKTWWLLRIALAVGPFFAGLDKFFNLLTDWTMYLSPLAQKIVPLSPHAFMRTVGVIEMAAGILVLTRYTKLAAYVICAWLVGIALNLASTGIFFDLAVRDIEIAVAAFVLARLTAEREAADASPVQTQARLEAIARGI
jgi:uncharacterized membrane protein YphA (DoxX/SURF4 family)